MNGGIMTVGEMRELLAQRDANEQMVVAGDGWYYNIGQVDMPEYEDGEPVGDYMCVTIQLGTDFDSRQV